MPPVSEQKPNLPSDSPASCQCHRPSWTEVWELLEMERRAADRERAWDDCVSQRDLVDLFAAERHRFYRLIGGTDLPLGAFPAKVRGELLTREHF
jgi:hypothetical protein